MVELKAAGAVLLSISAGLMGCFAGRELHQRIILLRELSRGLHILSLEISRRRTLLGDALQGSGRRLQEPWKSFFCTVGEALENLPEKGLYAVWERAEKEYLKETPLLPEDLELLRQIGRQLEDPEHAGESSLLAICEERLEEQIQEAKREYESKARLYGRLGIAGGIFLVILLI